MEFGHDQILSAFLPLRDKRCRAKCGYARDMNSILVLVCIDLRYRYRVDPVWNPAYVVLPRVLRYKCHSVLLSASFGLPKTSCPPGTMGKYDKLVSALETIRSRQYHISYALSYTVGTQELKAIRKVSGQYAASCHHEPRKDR